MKKTQLTRKKGLSRQQSRLSGHGNQIQRGKGLSKKVSEERLADKREVSRRLKELYQSVWDSRRHMSEVSGQWLGQECKSVFCHHILPKNRYVEAMYDPQNIILLTWEEHSRVENGYSYPEVEQRKEQLKQKYGL